MITMPHFCVGSQQVKKKEKTQQPANKHFHPYSLIFPKSCDTKVLQSHWLT